MLRFFRKLMKTKIRTAILAVALGIVAALPLSAFGVPVIYCTDLFHPHDDPDDHFDLATLFALPELEVKAILLDQGDKQLKRPGAIPIQQMMHLTGRQVPFAIGLAQKLISPGDDGRAQPAEFQAAVNLLLKTLREASAPVKALQADLQPWHHLVWEMDRNMWCTASLLHAAARKVHKVNGAWTASRQPSTDANATPFSFVPARVAADETGKTTWEPNATNSNARLFKMLSAENYGPAMRDCLRELLGTFPPALLTQADVFVSGKDGYHTYRIPAIEAAPDGSLIAFAEARKYSADDPGFGNQDIDLVYKRSTDNGTTWSPMTVLEDPGELWSAANPATLVDRTNGRLWVFYLRSQPGRSTDTARPGTDDLQTMARWSDDNGCSWSQPLDLTATARDMKDPAWRASVAGPGGAIQTRTGRLLIPMWKAPFANFALYSDDHGHTWQRGQFVPGKQGGDECQAVELADGRILMDIRQETGSNRWLAESTDGGTTWGQPGPGLAVTPVACAIERFTLQSASEERNRLLWTGPKGPERKHLRLLTSYDEGRTFAHERLVSDDYAAYSDLTILKDQTVGVLWERGVDRGYQFITFTRLNRAWLEEPSSTTQPPAPKVISQGDTAGTYQAFPDICRLKNGDLLCVFYAGYGHVSLPRENCPKGGRVCCVRSTDEGRTWSAPRILFDGPFDDRDPHIAQMRSGAVVCSFFTYRPQPDGKVRCDTCLVASRDGGATWETEPQIVSPEWPSSAPVRELADGTRILGVYREDGATAYGGIIRSTDGGKTWCPPIPIGQGSGVRLDAETDFVSLKDGTLYAALRGDRVNMHFATSPDGGLTWSPVRDIGFPGHCPHFTRLSTGEILLVHRLPLTALHISRDEGRTWQGPYQIDQTGGAYPSTVELKDGTVLVVYYEEGANSAVRARRFRVTANGIEFLTLGPK